MDQKWGFYSNDATFDGRTDGFILFRLLRGLNVADGGQSGGHSLFSLLILTHLLQIYQILTSGGTRARRRAVSAFASIFIFFFVAADSLVSAARRTRSGKHCFYLLFVRKGRTVVKNPRAEPHIRNSWSAANIWMVFRFYVSGNSFNILRLEALFCFI